MISMDKIQIINYLRDYAYLNERFVARKEKSLIDSFYLFMRANNQIDKINDEYINTMIKTYHLYIKFKMYSITEDYFLNRDDNISNTDIDSFVHNCNFIEKPSNMTNKRLLEIIRNTFNHSLDSNLKISKNAKNIEIDIDDIRYPRQIAKGGNKEPLKMRFNINYIDDLNNLIAFKGRNILFTSFDIPEDFNINSNKLYNELSKIKFSHYYFDKKLDEEVSNKFKLLNKENLLTNEEKIDKSKKLHDLGSSINPPVKFDLTHDQKKKAELLIKQYREYNPELIEENKENVLYFILNDLIPVPGLKLHLFNEQLYYLSLLTDGNNLNFNQIIQVIGKSYSKKEEYETIMNMKDIDKLYLIRHLANGDFSQAIPYIMYIDAVINHLCDEEIITIDGKEYDKNRLRNAFTHVRWYIGENSKIHLFDANPRNIYDLDLIDVGVIDLKAFIKWADEYILSKQKEENKKLTYKNI
ncbi:MAG: hypothetical protein IJ105_03065 [Bacilli bacterium]|nr:hypothetical protein [Bacilli bacterium]